jgi:Flp pilus assembly pilin Flp
MKKVITTAKNIWKDESGQGAVEYILLLVVVVSVVTLFKERITGSGSPISKAVDELSNKIGAFK